jgi:phosphatidate cytidylyltransferase
MSTSAPGTSELKKRVLAGIVMAALAIATNIAGGWLFALFWLLAALAVAYEWQKLIGGAAFSARLCFALAGVLLAAGSAFLGYSLLIALGLVVATLAALPAEAQARNAAAVGGAYAAVLGASVILCRGDSTAGLVVIFWLFAIVWGTDICAYFAGRALGGPKLWPRVSPKKTWSGALGGLVAAIALGCAVLWVANYGFHWSYVIMSYFISVASQLGDLFESAVKRRFDAKDSSQLIPGHGGFMDRLDGFIFAVVLAAIIGALRGGVFNVPGGLLGAS